MVIKEQVHQLSEKTLLKIFFSSLNNSNKSNELPLSKLEVDAYSKGIHLTKISEKKIMIYGFTLDLERIDRII